VQRRAAALLARPEDRAGKPRRPGEQPLSLAPGRDHDRPLQQLPDNPEGKVTLELAADGSQPAQAPLARRFARGLEQLALADPRRPLDHQHAPGARARRVDQRGDLRQFGIALEHGSPGQTYAPSRLLARAADATADSFGRPGQTLVATPDAQRAPRRDARGVTRPPHRTRLTLEIESTGGQIKGYLEDAAGRRQPFAGWLELAAALEAALPELAPYERGSPNAGPARTGARPTTVIDEPVPVIPCANGKSVMSTFTLTRTVTTFFDQDGTPLREVRQARVAGRVSSKDGSRSVPYGGRIHRVFDFATGLVTVTGRSLFADSPGPDAATAGRYVFDPETDSFVLERGRTPTESERQICAYLYPDS
jgi:hypothetical protein